MQFRPPPRFERRGQTQGASCWVCSSWQHGIGEEPAGAWGRPGRRRNPAAGSPSTVPSSSAGTARRQSGVHARPPLCSLRMKRYALITWVQQGCRKGVAAMQRHNKDHASSGCWLVTLLPCPARRRMQGASWLAGAPPLPHQRRRHRPRCCHAAALPPRRRRAAAAVGRHPALPLHPPPPRRCHRPPTAAGRCRARAARRQLALADRCCCRRGTAACGLRVEGGEWQGPLL